MNTTRQHTELTSLLWVEVTVPNQPAYWARTSRILADTSQAERDHTLALLKAGKRIAFEASGICIQCVAMSSRDQKRLEHLLSFEEGGFRLATFRHNIALFSKGNQDYYSLNEMAERGFLPTQAIAVSQWNVPITTLHGQVLDVFVPVALGIIYFTNTTLNTY